MFLLIFARYMNELELVAIGREPAGASKYILCAADWALVVSNLSYNFYKSSTPPLLFFDQSNSISCNFLQLNIRYYFDQFR